MAIRKMTMMRWQKAVAASLGKPDWHELNGDSPGGVAAELGVSRQAVHQLVHRGTLDAVIVTNDAGELLLFMIPRRSVLAHLARKKERAMG